VYCSVYRLLWVCRTPMRFADAQRKRKKYTLQDKTRVFAYTIENVCNIQSSLDNSICNSKNTLVELIFSSLKCRVIETRLVYARVLSHDITAASIKTRYRNCRYNILAFTRDEEKLM